MCSSGWDFRFHWKACYSQHPHVAGCQHHGLVRKAETSGPPPMSTESECAFWQPLPQMICKHIKIWEAPATDIGNSLKVGKPIINRLAASRVPRGSRMGCSSGLCCQAVLVCTLLVPAMDGGTLGMSLIVVWHWFPWRFMCWELGPHVAVGSEAPLRGKA